MVLEEEYAYENTLCPVCARSDCTAHHARHSEGELEVHVERKKTEEERELAQEYEQRV